MRRLCFGISSSGNGDMRHSGDVGSSSERLASYWPWGGGCGHDGCGCAAVLLSASRSAPQFSQKRLPAAFRQAQFGQVIKAQSLLFGSDEGQYGDRILPSLPENPMAPPCLQQLRVKVPASSVILSRSEGLS